MKKLPDGRRIFTELKDDDGTTVSVVQANSMNKRCWVFGDHSPYLSAKQARKLAKGLIRFAEWAEKDA